MPTYAKAPSRLNLVSLIVLLGLLAGVYSLIKFGPLYYRRWKAAGVVSDYTNRLYEARMRVEASPQALEELKTGLLKELTELGIEGTLVLPQFERSPTMARVTVQYREVVRHWFVNRTTTLEFKLSDEAARTED